MKLRLPAVLPLPVLLCLCTLAWGQETVRQRDAREIIYQANLVMAQYEQLLNAISFADAYPSEVQALIAESYGESKNKIFFDSKVIIEDDINPRRIDSNGVEDRQVDQYLKAFNVNYQKTPDESVQFLQKRFSNVKKGSYYYVNVGFTNVFRNAAKIDSVSYKPTRRVATLRFEQVGGRWRGNIAAVRFRRYSDSVRAEANDLVVVSDGSDAAPGGSAATVANSQLSGAVSLVMQDEARKDYAEARANRDKAYERAIQTGDSLVKLGQYDLAVEQFQNASDINPYHYLGRARLKEAEREQQRRREMDKQEVQSLEAMSIEAWEVRDYTLAKTCLERLQLRQPGNEAVRQRLTEVEARLLQIGRIDAMAKTMTPSSALKVWNKELDRVVEDRDPIHTDFLVQRAKVFMADGDTKRAKKDLDAALRLVPLHRPALLARAAYYQKTGAPHNALADYTTIIAKSRFAGPYYQERAQIKMGMRDTVGALQDFEQAIALAPDNHELLYKRALVHMNSRKFQKAINDLTKALSLSRDNATYQFQRGLAYLGQGDIERASQDLAKANEIGLTESQKTMIRDRAISRYETGKSLLEHGNYFQAQSMFTEAVTIDPMLAEAWQMRARAHLGMHQFEAARESAGRALQLRQGFFEAYIARSQALRGLGQLDAAIAEAQPVLAAQPLHTEAILAVTAAKEAQGLPQEAILLLDNAIKANTKDPRIFLSLAELYARQREIDKADRMISKAGKNGATDTEIYAAEANMALADRDFSAAQRKAEKSLKTPIQTREALFYRAQALLGLGETVQALQDLQRLQEKDPYMDMPEVRTTMARCYLKQMNAKRAMQVMEPVGLLPAYQIPASYYIEMGNAKLALADRTGAIESFNKALEIQQNHAGALFGIGCCHLAAKDNDKALEFYERAFKTKMITSDEVKKDPRVKELLSDKRMRTLIKTYL